jgi:hypothetical protein
MVAWIVVGAVLAGTQINSADNEVLLLGRVLVRETSDASVAYDLSIQIRRTPLTNLQSPAG